MFSYDTEGEAFVWKVGENTVKNIPTNHVTYTQISQDGKTCLCGCSNGDTEVWDINGTYKLIKKLLGSNKKVRSAIFSPKE